MKTRYLIAVKIPNDTTQIFTFQTKKEREYFAKQIKSRFEYAYAEQSQDEAKPY